MSFLFVMMIDINIRSNDFTNYGYCTKMKSSHFIGVSSAKG